MSSKHMKIVAGIGFCAIFALSLLPSAEAQPGQTRKSPKKSNVFKPAQELEQMMAGQKYLFGGIKAGILDETWDEAVIKAWILAEMANANQFQNAHADYKKLAGQMSEQCADLAKTLKKHDAKESMEKFSAIGKTCGSCHDQFGKKH